MSEDGDQRPQYRPHPCKQPAVSCNPEVQQRIREACDRNRRAALDRMKAAVQEVQETE